MREVGISNWSTERIGILVYGPAGTLVDADGNVIISITRDVDSAPIVTNAVATRDGEGMYSYIITSGFTAVKGDYTATWTYTLNGEARVFKDNYSVVNPQPYWDNASPDERMLIENVYHRVSDNSDSTKGGPYLWELPQTTFGFETIARLMVTDAIPYINLTGQPTFDYVPFNIANNPQNPQGKAFPKEWYGLLERAVYWAYLRHISRSYIEQPTYQNLGGAAYIDRSSYRERWKAEADSEKELLDEQLKWLKRQFLGGTHRSMLVAGGLFPAYFSNPARPSFYIPAHY